MFDSLGLVACIVGAVAVAAAFVGVLVGEDPDRERRDRIERNAERLRDRMRSEAAERAAESRRAGGDR